MSDNIGNENDVKLITLDHIQQIKDYIDKTDANLNYRIDNELKDYISEELKQAADHIQADHDSKYKELQDQLAYLEQFGTEEEIRKIKLQIEALEGNTQNKFEALDGLERELGRLSGEYQELYDGVITGKVFNAGQLDEIINTALIEKTKITEDMVETPNVYTSNLVALIGKFGQINAANIVGGEISGHTIQSNNKMVGTDTPVWQIKDAGDGHLAGENIKWDKDGNVTFGPGVKITFDSVQGAEDKLKDLMSGYDDDLQKYVEDAVKTSAAGAISREELEKRVQETKAAADEAIETLTNTVNLNKENIETNLQTKIDLVNQQIEQARKDGNAELLAGLEALKSTLEGQLATVEASIQTRLNEAMDAVDENIKASYALSSNDLKIALEKVDVAIDKAVVEGNIELIEKLAELRGELSAAINTMNREFEQVNDALSSIRGDIGNLQNSGLDPNGIGELLAAAMIGQTEISGTQVVTPSLLAKKIVGLVGTFGTINASKIVGTNIQGYTVSSPLDVKDENGNPVYTDEYEQALNDDGTPMKDENGNPIYTTMLNPETGEYEPVRKKQQIDVDNAAWALKSDGTGHLAKGQIEWHYDNDTTVVTFGDSVKINWNNVDGGKDYVDGQLTKVQDEFQNTLDTDIAAAKSELLTDIADTYVSQEGIFTGTIRSSAYEVNEDGTVKSTPYWMLDYLGDGHLAKGNISWDKDGNVTFGPGVTITWENFKEGKDAVNEVVNESLSGIVDDKVETAVNNSIGDISDSLAAAEAIKTKITGEGIYTGTVAAVKEGSGDVKPENIKTDDAIWALKEDGSGWLANGGIKWGTGGGLLLDGAIKLKWKTIDSETTTGPTYNFVIDNDNTAFYEVDGEYIPKNSNYKINTKPQLRDVKNILSLPTNDNWDGTEIIIMNNGNGDLYLGNALITDIESSIGEISSYDNATTDSGLSYSIGAGALINFIGVKGHPFKAAEGNGHDVSWFTTSNGAASKVSRYLPLYVQLWSAADNITINLLDKDNPFTAYFAISDYTGTTTGRPKNCLVFLSPSSDLITMNAAPKDKTDNSTDTYCWIIRNINTADTDWLINDNIWNTGSNAYFEIYVRQSNNYETNNKAYAFSELYFCNYDNTNPTSNKTYKFDDVELTDNVPSFIGTAGDKWYKYKISLSNVKALFDANNTPTKQSIVAAFNSKWDPEANYPNGKWIQTYKPGNGPSKVALIGNVVAQKGMY